MRKVFLNLSFILLTVSLSAQIMVTSEDHPREIGDTVLGIAPTNSEALTLPMAGEDMVWDYTNLEFNPNNVGTYVITPAGTHPAFPDGNLIAHGSGGISTLPGLVIPLSTIGRIDDNGLDVIGRITGAVSYPIGAVTGVPTDSLYFLEENHIYGDNPDRAIIMPINYGDNYAYDFGWSYDFLLTATPFGLNLVPSQIDYNFSKTKETIGWGILKTKEPLTGNIVEVEVLLVKTTTVEVDSILLAGQPAPTVLLEAFGATQAETYTTYSYQFWTKGLKRNAFSISVGVLGTISGNMSTDLGDFISSTAKVKNNLIPVTVFPNPAKDAFTVEFAKESADTWTFELYNILGQLVHQQTIEGYQNKTVVSPNTKSTGLYSYSLKNENGVIVGSGKVLLE